MSQDAYIPPPPKADETFGNVRVARVAVVDGRRRRTKKDLEQLNTKVPTGLGRRIDDVRREVEADLKRDVTRGELLEMMLAAFEASRAKGNIGEALAALRTPEPAAEDRASGRGQLVQFFASRDVEAALKEMVRVRGWSMGAVIEDTMAKAARLVSIEGRGKR